VSGAPRTVAGAGVRDEGGGTGAGQSQLVPSTRINLHFTGDFHAITSAHNLLAALLDNHLYWGNALRIDRAACSGSASST